MSWAIDPRDWFFAVRDELNHASGRCCKEAYQLAVDLIVDCSAFHGIDGAE